MEKDNSHLIGKETFTVVENLKDALWITTNILKSSDKNLIIQVAQMIAEERRFKTRRNPDTIVSEARKNPNMLLLPSEDEGKKEEAPKIPRIRKSKATLVPPSKVLVPTPKMVAV
jgi:vacuolar-type H+-ATPase subunit F/Vma7